MITDISILQDDIMHQYFIRRFFQGLIAVFILLSVMFYMTYVIGDPTMLLLPQNATHAQVEALREHLGLDKPLYVRFLNFLMNITGGTMGTSFYHAESALKLVLGRAKATFELAGASFLLALVISVPLGIAAASHRGSWFDRVCLMGSLIGISAPTFWVGILFILIFSITWRLLPSSGRGGIFHLILPATTLGLFQIGLFLRLIRSEMLDILGQDYIQTARSKGIAQHIILYKHGLRNALIPFTTVAIVQLGRLIGFSIVTETVFAWPGMGRLLLESLQKLDYPVIIAYVLVTGIMFLFLNMLGDLLYVFLDPRIRLK